MIRLSRKEHFDGRILHVDDANIVIDEFILIDRMSEMRIDLISSAIYGTPDYADVILKFNKISNPFSLKMGMVLAIPNIASYTANSKYVTPISVNIKERANTDISKPTGIAIKEANDGANYTISDNGVIKF